MWGAEAVEYLPSIDGLSDGSWQLILDGALKISQEIKTSRRRTGVAGAGTQEPDDRGMLIEYDEEFEDDEDLMLL
jgi:hypothetical protein